MRIDAAPIIGLGRLAMRLGACTIGAAVMLVWIGGPALAAAPKAIGTLAIPALSAEESAVFAFAAAGSIDPEVGTGKFAVSKFALSKPLDAMSPKLLHATAAGELLPQARIDLTAAKGVRPIAVTLVLSDVQITADALSDGGETVDLTFKKICEIAHAPGGDVQTCWDFSQNTGS